MFSDMSGNILSFGDINDYFSCTNDNIQDDVKQQNDIKENSFVVHAYKNLSGRPIVFEDVRDRRTCNSITTVKSYILSVNGYLLVEDEEFDEIINSNPILKKIINEGMISECDLSEAREYYEEKNTNK